MLEAIREHSKGWLAKIILALITIPFMLWGVESYFQGGGDEVVASVNGDKISRQEFDRAIKAQQEEMRATLGAAFDAALFDDPRIRQSLLDGLINQRLIVGTAAKIGMVASDAQVAKVIAELPAFQENGRFSQTRYEQVLRQQGMSPAEFENRLRQELLINDMRSVFTASAMAPATVAARFFQTYEQQREISIASFSPEQFIDQAQVSAADVQAWYDAHKANYTLPEQARFDYVVLSLDGLAAQVTISDDEIKQFYQQNSAKYSEPEQRQASHILIPVGTGDDAQKRAAAKSRAEAIYQQLKANPASFAEVARRESGDTGSAAQGGDLGWFPRNAMVKPFADAVFSMQVGEIRGPVASDFGYHIIRLNGVKPAQTKPLDELKADIQRELQKQQAGKRFAEVAEAFSNQVYEQADSLKPVADALGLKVETSGWIQRKGGDGSLLSNPKMLQALFSEETLKNRRNTEAIEVAPNTLVSARLREYKPATLLPLETVRTDIEQQLRRAQAAALAEKQGGATLEQLRAGKEPGVQWSAFQVISRQQPARLPPALVEAVFRADAQHFPAYAGAVGADGAYTLVRVTRVIAPPAADAAKVRAVGRQLEQLVAQEDFAAYLASLKGKAKIKIQRASLEKTTQ